MAYKYHQKPTEEYFYFSGNPEKYDKPEKQGRQGRPERKEKKCPSIACDAQDQTKFCVPMSFDQELTAVTGTTGTVTQPLSLTARNIDRIRGVLKLEFNSTLSKAAYALYVFNATSTQNQITVAHLHLAKANDNGSIIVNLYTGPTTNVNGLLAKGLITNTNIINTTIFGLPAINSVASLYEAIREGAVYVNVHSTTFPNGIIRGQIFFHTSCSS